MTHNRRKPFKDYISEVYPGRELTPQQMAAVGRWLRKKGFTLGMEYLPSEQKQIKVIMYDSRQVLPTSCSIKINDVKPPRMFHRFRSKSPQNNIRLIKKEPNTFEEAVDYINELFTVLELQEDELNRIKEELAQERAAKTLKVPEPPEKVKSILQRYAIKLPREE